MTTVHKKRTVRPTAQRPALAKYLQRSANPNGTRRTLQARVIYVTRYAADIQREHSNALVMQQVSASLQNLRALASKQNELLKKWADMPAPKFEVDL